MKRLSLIVIAIFAIVFISQAQDKAKKEPKAPEQKAEKATQKWTQKLSLTQEQIPKVKRIFLDRAQKLDAIKAKYPADADKEKKKEESKKVKKDADSSLKNVFTQAQYDAYVKTLETEKAEKKNRKKGKGGKGDSKRKGKTETK